MTEDPSNVVELRRHAGAAGYNVVERYTGKPPDPDTVELLLLKPSEASLLDDDSVTRLGAVRAAVVITALEDLGRLRRRRLEELTTVAPVPPPPIALAVLRLELRGALEQAVADLASYPNGENMSGAARTLRDLADGYTRLGGDLELTKPPPAGGLDADEVLDTVYRIVGALPGLDNAYDHADTVRARLAEELKP